MSTPFPGPPSEPIPPLPSLDLVHFKPPQLVHHSSSMVHLPSDPGDPRKTRRQCTDFGFRRPSIPSSVSEFPLDNYSVVTSVATPPGTFTSSDSDISSAEDLQFDFPRPPPISPVLRRMQSSPLFTLDDADSHSSKRKRWGAMVMPRIEGSASQIYETNGVADNLSDLDADTLLFNSHFVSACHDKNDNLCKSKLDLDNEGESLITQAPHRSRHASPLSPVTAASLPPNIVRSAVASSIPTNVTVSSAYGPSITPRRISAKKSLKFSPESTESLERLDITMEKPRQQKSLFRGRSVSMNFHVPDPSSNLPRPPCPSQIPDRTRLNCRDKNGALPSPATPFLHRPLHTTFPSHSHAHGLSASGLNSFIDIAPDQDARRSSIVHRDRIKRLFTRASRVFDWSKSSKKKNSTADFTS
ncbi:hypothetical protein K435DRAFT_130736 [Dendrothele bispora CBS 962.96]|uniref:Uncharacterized protein n=1 Tax=Dendrothele bispora (strain CBS 962.96) TaxID=1314807 RepID=A0A4S8M033_DENBC|nr:hypothetical protein K435DRAFT_130736 [Dendrothele bispora CBS 962.96]